MDYFFGLYLLDEGIVDQEQIHQAVLLTEKENRKIGELALDAKYISKKEIDKIRIEQRLKRKLFGETAVELGFLTDAQVIGLIAKQASLNTSMGDALLELSFITKEQLQESLKTYKRKQRETVDSLKQQVSSDEVIPFIIDYLPALVLQVANVHSKVEKIDSWEPFSHHDLKVSIRLEGKTSFTIAMDVSMPLARQVAKGMFEMEEITDEMAIDVIKEILNLLAGGVNEHYETLGWDYAIGLPEQNNLPSTGLCCQVATSSGNGLLIFSRS
ncbi:MAG: hypothetical protein GY854_18395 [Deltaproteobacteria bacterium]|nr:hypothetical protein [Deltaproteobacteria bacterium]